MQQAVCQTAMTQQSRSLEDDYLRAFACAPDERPGAAETDTALTAQGSTVTFDAAAAAPTTPNAARVRTTPMRKSALLVAEKIAAITEWETCSESSRKFREVAAVIEAEFAAEKNSRFTRAASGVCSFTDSDASEVSQDAHDEDQEEDDASHSAVEPNAELNSDSEFVPESDSSESVSDESDGAEESDVVSVDEDDISDIADSDYGESETLSEGSSCDASDSENRVASKMKG